MQPEFFIKPGTKVGDYEFKKMISRGGSAEIYLVRSAKFNIDFVAKVVPKSREVDHKTEVALLQRMDTPHIIKIYDSYETDQCFIQIIEYCPYGSMNDIITRNGRIDEQPFKKYAHDIIQGLKYSHANMVAHSDIKPANVLIDSMGKAKLADFGIAQLANQLSFQFAGSIPFVAPEILQKSPYDPLKADIWSLGVTFYTMLEGEIPWPIKLSEMTRAIKLGVYRIPHFMSPRMSKIVALMLRVDPDLRPTIAEIAQMPEFQPTRAGFVRACTSTGAFVEPLTTNVSLTRKKRTIQLFNHPLYQYRGRTTHFRTD